jgi:hypothetical protein
MASWAPQREAIKTRVLRCWGHQAMLRIEKDFDGCATRLILSGRIRSDHIACLRSASSAASARKVLDLTEVTLVDLGVVPFLIRCGEEGIEFMQCPSYVREWMFRERAEQTQPENA